PWQPLLSGDLAARARETIAAIVADLPRFPMTRPDLPSGKTGLALLHAYRAKAGEVDAAAAADAALEQAMDGAAEGVLPPWLHGGLQGGFSGVAWAIEHLWRTGPDGDDANEEIDAALLDHLAQGGPESYDLIAGLAGLAVYAIERGPRGEALLAAIVDAFDRR